MAGKSVLLVVGIVEAREFPSRADCLLVVEGRLGREGLATDPAPLERGSVKVGQELAWSMTRRALQQHRVQRSPLKLQVYALDKASNVRQLMGYALLDIRTARVREQNPKWCNLLGPGHAHGSRPQLLVSLSLEEEEEEATEGGGAGEEPHVGEPAAKEGLAGNTAQHTLTLTLAKGGGYYTLGPPSSHQHTFTLSLTLTNPSNIPQPPAPGSQLYFYYCLLGNDITSEPFVVAMFQPERASIRVRSSQELVHLLMSAQEDMQLHLCSGSQSLARGNVPLKLLGTRDYVHLTLQLGAEGRTRGTTPLPTVEVTLQLECDSLPPSPSPLPSLTAAFASSKKPTTPTSVSLEHTHAHTAAVAGGLSTSPSTQSGVPSPISPPYPRSSPLAHTPPTTSTMNQPHTAKRNLTKSFEEADSSPATPTNLQGTQSAHQPPPTAHLTTPTIHEATPTIHEATPTKVQIGSAGVYLSTAYPSASSVAHPHTLTHPSTVAHSPTLTHPSTVAHPPTLTHPSTVAHPPTLTHPSTVAHPLTVTAGVPLGSPQNSSAKATATGPSKSTIGRNMGVVSPANPAHHFRFSVDTRSIHNVNMGEGLQCYLRYHYPFFGSTHPVLVTPPVAVNTNTECSFSQSYCAFDFATSPHQLVEQLHSQPLSVEVWHSISSPGSQNQLVGIAKVPLSEVLSQEKMEVGGASRQLCALRVPIIPTQPRTTAPGLALPHCGYLHTVLVLEDRGRVRVVRGGEVTEEKQKEKTGQAQLITAQEYQAALELEMWKLSQEEAWQADLRGREANHMSQLAAEWHRRDQQRQQLLREKLSAYSSLEQQLQEALKEVQLQRQQLKDREGELSQERSLLSRDRQSLQDECGRRLREAEEIHQQQLLQERYKTEQFQSQVTKLKSQVEDLEGRCASKEAEFEAYRRQVSTRPESRLQAELSMAQLEKGELQRKLASALRSKQHYKEQWSNALKELANLRQREQAAARQHLHRQQEELEALRVKFLQQSEQQQLRTELSSTRTHLQKLQERTVAQNSTEQEMPSTEAPPLGGGAPPSGVEVDPAVARWIEERDILLQTGVYSSSDPTIARLDQKIREALPTTLPHTNFDV